MRTLSIVLAGVVSTLALSTQSAHAQASRPAATETRVDLKIEGLDNSSTRRAVERALSEIEGVQQVAISRRQGMAAILVSPGAEFHLAAVIAALAECRGEPELVLDEVTITGRVNIQFRDLRPGELNQVRAGLRALDGVDQADNRGADTIALTTGARGCTLGDVLHCLHEVRSEELRGTPAPDLADVTWFGPPAAQGDHACGNGSCSAGSCSAGGCGGGGR
jgi:copper chaperone CopZ